MSFSDDIILGNKSDAYTRRYARYKSITICQNMYVLSATSQLNDDWEYLVEHIYIYIYARRQSTSCGQEIKYMDDG
jgi:hypothetical protein